MSDTRVYFIRCRATSAIKIGVASDPQTRLRALQIGSASVLELVGEMPGDERYEALLHEAFAEYRTHGEWFACGERLDALIAALPAMPTVESMRPISRHRSKTPYRPTGLPLIHQPDMVALIDEFYEVIRRGVHEFGIERAAAVIGVKSGALADAIHRRNRRHFQARWLPELLPHFSLKIRRSYMSVALRNGPFCLADGKLVRRDSAETANAQDVIA